MGVLLTVENGYISRLLALAKSKSIIEREWFAEREREKGNDLFKAES
jgi:hypothetical protein